MIKTNTIALCSLLLIAGVVYGNTSADNEQNVIYSCSSGSTTDRSYKLAIDIYSSKLEIHQQSATARYQFFQRNIETTKFVAANESPLFSCLRKNPEQDNYTLRILVFSEYAQVFQNSAVGKYRPLQFNFTN